MATIHQPLLSSFCNNRKEIGSNGFASCKGKKKRGKNIFTRYRKTHLRCFSIISRRGGKNRIRVLFPGESGIFHTHHASHRARKEARSLPLKRNLNVICTSEAKQGKILGKHRRNSSRRVHLLRLRNILVRVSEYAATTSTNAYANRKVGTKKQGGTSAVREFQRLR